MMLECPRFKWARAAESFWRVIRVASGRLLVSAIPETKTCGWAGRIATDLTPWTERGPWKGGGSEERSATASIATRAFGSGRAVVTKETAGLSGPVNVWAMTLITEARF